MKLPPIAIILLVAAAALPTFGQAPADKAAIRDIVAAFDKIEAEHKDWRHITYRAENLDGGGSFENHVWLSPEAPQWVKVEANNYDDHGESKTQYFFKGDDLVFTLDRSESSAAQIGAPNEVFEQRYYFAGGKVIRQLRKQASIPAGKPTDLSKVENKEIDLSKKEDPADMSPEEVFSEQVGLATAIIGMAKKIDSDGGEEPGAAAAPEAGGATVGTGWRMIAGSSSADGRFALAWGIKGQDTVTGDEGPNGGLMVEPDTRDLVNYVVNLKEGSIIGTTSGLHHGDSANLGHSSVEVEWSKNSFPSLVAQLCNSKWETDEAMVYLVNEEGDGNAKLGKGFNLLEAVTKAIKDKTADLPRVKKHGLDSFALQLHDAALIQRNSTSLLSVEVSAQIPKTDAEDGYFDATLVFEFPSPEGAEPKEMKLRSVDIHTGE